MYNVSTQITAKATNGKKKKERETYSNGNDCNPKIEIRPYIEHQKQMTVCLENLQYQVWSDQTSTRLQAIMITEAGVFLQKEPLGQGNNR